MDSGLLRPVPNPDGDLALPTRSAIPRRLVLYTGGHGQEEAPGLVEPSQEEEDATSDSDAAMMTRKQRLPRLFDIERKLSMMPADAPGAGVRARPWIVDLKCRMWGTGNTAGSSVRVRTEDVTGGV